MVIVVGEDKTITKKICYIWTGVIDPHQQIDQVEGVTKRCLKKLLLQSKLI